MKVSKKSLIVSIAVLCVCALSLSAASFAWFTTSQTAKVSELEMKVNPRTTLQMRVNDSEDPFETVLDSDDFVRNEVFHNDAVLNDASTNAAVSQWVTAEYNKDTGVLENFVTGVAKPITSDDAEGNYLALPIEFRCTSQAQTVSVIATSASASATGALNKAVRMNFNSKIFAFGSGADAKWQPAGAAATTPTEAVTLNSLGTNEIVVELGATQTDGYRYGTTTIYVWIEGSDSACVDGNTPSTVTANINFGLYEVTGA